jgi:hypothetical protein
MSDENSTKSTDSKKSQAPPILLSNIQSGLVEISPSFSFSNNDIDSVGNFDIDQTSDTTESQRDLEDTADFSPAENNIERNRGEVLFYVQAFVLVSVVLACIINLSLGNNDTVAWTGLLSASLGILVPQPSISLAFKSTVKK